MKKSLIVLSALVLLSFAGVAQSQEAVVEQVASAEVSEAVDVGNKLCPVSGEKVGEMGDIVKVVHNGKSYNLCCAMCEKDFLKDPEKFSKIAEDEVLEQK